MEEKESVLEKTDATGSSKKRASENGTNSPPFLDDLVQWNKDFDDHENPSFFWWVNPQFYKKLISAPGTKSFIKLHGNLDSLQLSQLVDFL